MTSMLTDLCGGNAVMMLITTMIGVPLTYSANHFQSFIRLGRRFLGLFLVH
jgi:hypothetical protein